MATQNITLGSDYVLIAADTQSFFLSIPKLNDAAVEVATSDSEVAPTVLGHEFTGRKAESPSRTLLGAGFVYARSKSGAPISVRLDVWTPSP